MWSVTSSSERTRFCNIIFLSNNKIVFVITFERNTSDHSIIIYVFSVLVVCVVKEPGQESLCIQVFGIYSG